MRINAEIEDDKLGGCGNPISLPHHFTLSKITHAMYVL